MTHFLISCGSTSPRSFLQRVQCFLIVLYQPHYISVASLGGYFSSHLNPILEILYLLLTDSEWLLNISAPFYLAILNIILQKTTFWISLVCSYSRSLILNLPAISVENVWPQTYMPSFHQTAWSRNPFERQI